MLPGIGGVEYLVIAALIIIFVGPKELPTVLRAFGRWWSKIKNFSREFKSSINDIAAGTDIEDFRSSIEKTEPNKFTDEMRDSINKSILDTEGKEKDDESKN